jgi:hypothetical protein
MMMMKKILGLLLLLLSLSACLKQENEVPDTRPASDPQLAVNFSLQELNALYPAEGMPLQLDSDWVLGVLVRANDVSGNLFQQLVLEDSSGGISLLLNEDHLYSRFPVDQKVYLRVKGLFLGNNHGTLQLGGQPVADNSGQLQVSEIQPADFARYVVVTNVSTRMNPARVSMAYLSEPRRMLINRLIRIDEVEIDNPEQDRQYAEPLTTTNIKLHDCSGAGIMLRTSNYASFQAYPTPYGKGSITALYTVYNGVGQLIIRDTNDMEMGEVRCDGGARQEPEPVSIQILRSMYQGKDTVPGHLAIRGIVTSDAVNRNFGPGNIIVQDGQSAIMIYFGSQAGDIPDLGDSVSVRLSGATLTRYNGILEIKNIKSAQATVYGKGKSVAAVQLDIAELNTRFAALESVLVTISNAKITSAGNYGGSKTLKDASGTIILYTSSSASFATTPVPAISKTFRGIVTPYNTTNELKIRNPAIDVY